MADPRSILSEGDRDGTNSSSSTLRSKRLESLGLRSSQKNEDDDEFEDAARDRNESASPTRSIGSPRTKKKDPAKAHHSLHGALPHDWFEDRQGSSLMLEKGQHKLQQKKFSGGKGKLHTAIRSVIDTVPDDAESLYQMGLEFLRERSSSSLSDGRRSGSQSLHSSKDSGRSGVTTNPLTLTSLDPKKALNPQLAAFYLKHASAKSHARADFVLALMYKSGEGVVPSAHKFLFHLERSSKHGLPRARLELGILFAKGYLVPKDIPKAKKLLQAAASAGEVGAWKELALALPEEALVYWENGAKMQDPESFYELAKRGMQGIDHIPSSLAKIMEHLKSSATKRWPEALHLLGEFYRGVMNPQICNPTIMEKNSLQNLIRRDCVKASRYLALGCEAFMNERNRLQQEVDQYEAKILSLMQDFDKSLSVRLTMTRALQKWSWYARERKRCLEKMISNYNRNHVRPAFTIWGNVTFAYVLKLHKAMEQPWATAAKTQRLFSYWYYTTIKIPNRLIVLAREKYYDKLLRKLIQAWRLVHSSKKKGAIKLTQFVKSKLRNSLVSLIPAKEHQHSMKAIKRLEVLLRKKFLYHQFAKLKFQTEKKALTEEFDMQLTKLDSLKSTLDSELRGCYRKIDSQAEEIDMWRKRYEEESRLNRKLLDTAGMTDTMTLVEAETLRQNWTDHAKEHVKRGRETKMMSILSKKSNVDSINDNETMQNQSIYNQSMQNGSIMPTNVLVNGQSMQRNQSITPNSTSDGLVTSVINGQSSVIIRNTSRINSQECAQFGKDGADFANGNDGQSKLGNPSNNRTSQGGSPSVSNAAPSQANSFTPSVNQLFESKGTTSPTNSGMRPGNSGIGPVAGVLPMVLGSDLPVAPIESTPKTSKLSNISAISFSQAPDQSLPRGFQTTSVGMLNASNLHNQSGLHNTSMNTIPAFGPPLVSIYHPSSSSTAWPETRTPASLGPKTEIPPSKLLDRRIMPAKARLEMLFDDLSPNSDDEDIISKGKIRNKKEKRNRGMNLNTEETNYSYTGWKGGRTPVDDSSTSSKGIRDDVFSDGSERDGSGSDGRFDLENRDPQRHDSHRHRRKHYANDVLKRNMHSRDGRSGDKRSKRSKNSEHDYGNPSGGNRRKSMSKTRPGSNSSQKGIDESSIASSEVDNIIYRSHYENIEMRRSHDASLDYDYTIDSKAPPLKYAHRKLSPTASGLGQTSRVDTNHHEIMPTESGSGHTSKSTHEKTGSGRRVSTNRGRSDTALPRRRSATASFGEGKDKGITSADSYTANSYTRIASDMDEYDLHNAQWFKNLTEISNPTEITDRHAKNSNVKHESWRNSTNLMNDKAALKRQNSGRQSSCRGGPERLDRGGPQRHHRPQRHINDHGPQRHVNDDGPKRHIEDKLSRNNEDTTVRNNPGMRTIFY